MLKARNWMTEEKIELKNVKEVNRGMFETVVVFEDGSTKAFPNFAWDIY